MVQSSRSIRELSPEAQRPDLYLKRLLCVAVLANPPRRNEAFVIPGRTGREIWDRDTQFCMAGLVWLTQRVHKRCEGHRVTLLCRQKLLSALAEQIWAKQALGSFVRLTAAVCGAALKDPLNSNLHTPLTAPTRGLFLFLHCFPYPPHGDLRGPLLEWKFSCFFTSLFSHVSIPNGFVSILLYSKFFLLSKNQQPFQAPATTSSYISRVPDTPSEQELSQRVGLLRKRRWPKLFSLEKSVQVPVCFLEPQFCRNKGTTKQVTNKPECEAACFMQSSELLGLCLQSHHILKMVISETNLKG